MLQTVRAISPTPSSNSRTSSSPSNRIAARFACMDASNVGIGAQQIAACRQGLVPSPELAALRKIIDPRTRIRFAEIRKLVLGNDELAAKSRAICVLSTKPGVPSVVAPAAAAAGWDVMVVERAPGGKEKEADVAIAVHMVDEAWSLGLTPEQVEVTLLSGDRDIRPAAHMLTSRGFWVDVMAWRHSTSSGLVHAASRYLPLDPFFELITFRA